MDTSAVESISIVEEEMKLRGVIGPLRVLVVQNASVSLCKLNAGQVSSQYRYVTGQTRTVGDVCCVMRVCV